MALLVGVGVTCSIGGDLGIAWAVTRTGTASGHPSDAVEGRA
ncbi:hypothetical protein ABZ079_00025 [Streptomyces sp. NPDC006314]